MSNEVLNEALVTLLKKATSGVESDNLDFSKGVANRICCYAG